MSNDERDPETTELTMTSPVPYPKAGSPGCVVTGRSCWSKSFCTIYGCAKHPRNVEERQRIAEELDRRLGYAR